MLRLRPYTYLTLRSLTPHVTGARNYNKDYDDDEKRPKSKQDDPDTARKIVPKSEPPPTKEDDNAEEPAITRLNRLLASMSTQETLSLSDKPAAMARPGEGHRKRREAAKIETASKDIFIATKRIASLAGDGEQSRKIESELLAKLLRHNQEENVTLDADSAAVGKKTNNELSLSELIVGMKIDRNQEPKEQTRSEFVRRSIAAKKNQQDQSQGSHRQRKRETATYTGSVNLFGSEPLGIFKNPAELRDMPDMLTTWKHLQEHELKLLVTHPPANYFEKLALWTEQGKVWRFPIDNEQDFDDEVDVDFTEHIFLEQHLESWCPEKGPIRHYMELVCVGLSKNPYITVKDKKEHILWYRDYFEAKKDILKDCMSQEKQHKLEDGMMKV